MFEWFNRRRSKKGKNPPEQAKPDHGVPTVEFDPKLVTETVKADLIHNIQSLPDIPEDCFAMVHEAALQSITAGRDLHLLSQALMKIDGMSKRHASDISRLLNNKATTLIEKERALKLGIEYAIWRYSGAPCGNAEQDAAHMTANRKPYRIAQGMFLEGRWTWPGHEEGCKCTSRVIIPGVTQLTVTELAAIRALQEKNAEGNITD